MQRRYALATVILLPGIVLSLSLQAPAQAPTPAAPESCVSASCHAGMGKDKAVHPPVQGGCDSCHSAVADPEKKSKHPGNLTITLVQQGSALCAMCHEAKNTKKVVHAPIGGGDCTSCHDPHQSPNKAMLKESLPGLCFRCHPDSIAKQSHVHPPVAGGDCSACHDNHQSDFSGRLVLEGNALCFLCHADLDTGLKDRKVAHYPAKQSCLQCHNPHGSAAPAMLSAPVPDLCASCHPNETALRQKAVVKHGPMADQKSCKNCHHPHFSDQPKLLLTAELALCLACHDRELQTGKGKIANMKALLEANKNGHGPVKSGVCVTCHNPHGSDSWRLLVKYYPPDLYAPYADGRYALCLSCHDKAPFTERLTRTATGFRDGERNLHFVHVNRTAKGRSCRTCHEVHADDGQPKHVRKHLPFSKWAMPLNFTAGKDGGTCAPGCHGEKRYRR